MTPIGSIQGREGGVGASHLDQIELVVKLGLICDILIVLLSKKGEESYLKSFISDSSA